MEQGNRRICRMTVEAMNEPGLYTLIMSSRKPEGKTC